jgi:hypothetical protein
MKIKINSKIRNYKIGETIEIEDLDGIPTDIFWRNRLNDSKIDNCIEVITTQETISTEEILLTKKGKK